MGIFRFLFGRRSRLKAVQDSDFASYLERIGLLDEVKLGQKVCRSCGARITLDNIQAVVPADGDVLFICDKALCLKQVND